jgi:hypothetical protein
MKVYDNYEISPCTRTEEPDQPGHFYFEVCEPHEADVWTLYGHIDGEGVEAIGDFATCEQAEETFQRITGIPFAGSPEVAGRIKVMHAGPILLAALEELLADINDLSREYEICQEILGSSYGMAAKAAIEKARTE